ncbi:helix-turn-helix transcriptional regulator [Amycolatopsis sp. H20-H5]|uniref:helix-turn-helix transcriptional regulator n=1 Tax=Amycolatopsis sp. H20-H5 TaxID=3046309 RepID=UPI002DBF4C2F|nr:helix-turn-helix transcriptional regulator [Amycolatopsis sp. H20-H5]MEC3980417.1 helix-turn-helix transcriptional regulator [Amycolatopsis sp. H20-H5]
MAGKRTRLIRVRKAAGYTQESLGEALNMDTATVGRWELGKAEPLPHKRAKVARLLAVSRDELEALLQEGVSPAELATRLPAARAFLPARPADDDDEAAAWELARRVGASDVGNETLTQLETIVDDLAIAYSITPPAELVDRIRGYLKYVSQLMDARKTLAEHRRLLVVGGWLSLLAATVHIDLKQPAAARARLRTADSLAVHAEHDEIRAWGYETDAWWSLTDGNYHGALDLARRAQAFAPIGTSIAIQATAQEGRALARLGESKAMYDAIERVNRLVSPLQVPDRPEHHYRYDPNKSVAYMATTLAWAGDPAAEGFAREILARLAPNNNVGKWPRRVASANLDLALALIVSDRMDEAVGATHVAIASGCVVPSNHWRAAEVVKAVEARKMPDAKDLREAYEELRRSS